ncbi:tryptophan-rich sensory protein [Paenibacillus guangzhouensis]|uniref:tryptophan-rich sensory protein n=1 Tax=Paenibacillus guangzhouensis TaxID=1473112 RepID=UPI0012673EF3|nr:tryptophan-rich sensory protein [Paenibacillus guangzhouensis]
MGNTFVFAVGNAIAFVLVLVMNGLAEWLPIGGHTTGEISAMNPSRLTPASYAFLIWGMIYAALLVFIIYQLLPAGRARPEIQQIGGWFIVSCAMNIVWLLLWHYQYIESTLFIMLALLIALIAIYSRTRIPGPPVRDAAYWLLGVPFSLYLGWVVVATLTNLSVFLTHAYGQGEIAGLSQVTLSVWLLILTGFIALWAATRQHDPFFLLPIVWGLIAIGVGQTETAAIVYTSWIAAIWLGIAALRMAWRSFRWQCVT